MQNGLRTYRPNLDRYVFSNESIRKKVLKWRDGVLDGTVIRALLLTGPTGHGKTTLALALVEALGASLRDVHQINAGDTRKLDDARDIIDSMDYSPVEGKWRVTILDECHQLLATSQTAFLTPIENLPPRALLMAVTSEPQHLLPAFRNRFYEIGLEPYSTEQIVDILSGLPTELKASQIAMIAEYAGGNPRAAIGAAESGSAQPGEATVQTAPEGLLADQFLEAFTTDIPQAPYLVTTLVTEQNRKQFFERVELILEMTVRQQFRFSVSISPVVVELGLKLSRKFKLERLVRLLSEVSSLSGEPLIRLRCWAMQQAISQG